MIELLLWAVVVSFIAAVVVGALRELLCNHPDAYWDSETCPDCGNTLTPRKEH